MYDARPNEKLTHAKCICFYQKVPSIISAKATKDRKL